MSANALEVFDNAAKSLLRYEGVGYDIARVITGQTFLVALDGDT